MATNDPSYTIECAPSSCDIGPKGNADALRDEVSKRTFQSRRPYAFARAASRDLLRICPEEFACRLHWVGVNTRARQCDYVHMIPSFPGCLPMRSIFLISSKVTPSLLNKPPCVTKYRFKPSDDKIAFLFSAGGCEALIKVDKGTERDVNHRYWAIHHVRTGSERICKELGNKISIRMRFIPQGRRLTL